MGLMNEVLEVRNEMTPEELYEESILKGRFTRYIIPHLKSASADYDEKKKKEYERAKKQVEIDNEADYMVDMSSEDMFREIEVKLDLERAARAKLSSKESEWLRAFETMNYKEVAEHMECSTTYTYEKRQKIREKIKDFNRE